MNLNTRALAALLALVVAVTPVAAAEYIDGKVIATGKPAGDAASAYDGTSVRVLRSDPSGILRVTEEYPWQLQTDVFLGGTSVAVTTGLKQLTNGWTAHPHGDRVLRVRRVQTGGTGADPMYLYLYGSDDNVNFYPLMSTRAWSGLTAGYAASDTAFVDTLMIRFPSQPTTAEWKITLPATEVYPGRYLALFGRRDSTSGTTVARTTYFEGRYK